MSEPDELEHRTPEIPLSDWGKVMVIESAEAQVPTPPKKHLHVVFLNGSERWYSLDEHGWRLLPSDRMLRIGKGVGRKMIPLDNVEYYSPE